MLLIVPLGKKGTHGIPIFTLFICVACLIVYAFANTDADKLALAFHPNQLDPLKMFTSVLTHASVWHLIGNLFFFCCFARTIETRIFVPGYLLAFVVFVLATNLAYAAIAPGNVPTLGLSGVVWGYMGMFLFRYPREKIECFVWFFGVYKKVEIPTFVFILAFLVFDIVGFRHGATSVNYIAHFAGFAAGALYKLAFWNMLTTEEPAPKKKLTFGASGHR